MGHEPLEGCARVEWRRHAGAAIGAFGGVPQRTFGVVPFVRDLFDGGWRERQDRPRLSFPFFPTIQW
eukprot:1591-Pyramimonas_sp.AAC.1